MNKNEIDRAHKMHGGDEKISTSILLELIKCRDGMGARGTHGRVIMDL